jgi:hypothetical protein
MVYLGIYIATFVIVCFKEGRAFLEKNLTEWKKPLLISEAVDDSKEATGKNQKKTTFQVG